MTQINYSKYSHQELKEMLIEKGYDPDDLEGQKKIALVEALMEEDNEEETEFENVELEEEDLPQTKENNRMSSLPQVGTQEWQDYVMGHFREDEKWVFEDKTGDKVRKIDTYYAKAIARVGRLVLGAPLSEGPIREELSFNGPKNLPYSYVCYQVVVQGPRAFTAVADVSYLNTEDKFLAFPLRSAETKAMGCAWVKALGINIYAKEEFTNKDTAKAVEETTADWNASEEITSNQKKTITNMCSKLRIVVYNLLNMNSKFEYDGKTERYDGLDDPKLTKQKGVGLIDRLGQMQRNEIKVHDSLREVSKEKE